MKDDIVTTAAKMIAPEWFGEPWTDTQGRNAESDVMMAKRAYMQSNALRKATQILQLAARTPGLAKLLAEIEKDGWEKLGLPVRKHPEAERIIDDKYAEAKP